MYTPIGRKINYAIDWKLVICYLILIIFGWLNIYAAGHSGEAASIFDFSSRSGKQLIWIVSSLGLASLILFVFNPRLWEVISLPTYLFVLFLLVAVIFLGAEVKGSKSWFTLGPVSFQPAEISKITTSLLLAMAMSRPGFKLSIPKDFFLVAAIIAIPMLVIVAESETGSALVYLGFVFVLYREGFSGWILAFAGLTVLLFILTMTVGIFFSIFVLLGLVSLSCCINTGKIGFWFCVCVPLLALFYFSPKLISLVTSARKEIILIPAGIILSLVILYFGYRKKSKHLLYSLIAFVAGLTVIVSTNFVFNNILQDHQKKRIEVLLGLTDDPSGVGYNVHQSMIAIGSGGFLGKGFLNGTQTTFGFVPEQSTDFIFCTVGEEWGFVGCVGVILLYVFLIYRIITDAEKCRESFTRVFGYCVASILFMHLFINIGMTIGLMPVIGIPLPLMSYGGSSLWAFTILIFIFVALYRQEKKYF